MNSTTTVTDYPSVELVIQLQIEELLRSRFPNRNEKYYQILLCAREQLVSVSYKWELTADAIIKTCHTARPTWYAYFKSVKQYYTHVFEVIGSVMIDHALEHLKQNANYDNWTSVSRDVRMLVYLSNTRSITAYLPELQAQWGEYYDRVVESYAEILGPILKLSASRARLFIKNIANEIILHKEKYYADIDLFDRFVNREYVLFLAEQNN